MRMPAQEPLTLFQSIMGKPNLEPEQTITSGAINTIFVFRQDGKRGVLRVRTGEENFIYEKGFFKELLLEHFLASALTGIDNAAHNQKVLEEALDAAKQGVIPEQKSGVLPAPLAVGKIQMNGRSTPWMLQEYAEGLLMAGSKDREIWRELGRKIAFLHSFSLSSAGRFDAEARDLLFSQHVKAVIDEIAQKAPYALMRKFEIQSRQEAPFSLCHNDLHPLNIVSVKSGLHVLDWDNASISAPMQDLAKLQRWTNIDELGYLTPDADKFQAFLEGYREIASHEIDDTLLQLYELLFLCRVYRFEEKRENAGRSPQAPHPASDTYKQRIAELCQG